MGEQLFEKWLLNWILPGDKRIHGHVVDTRGRERKGRRKEEGRESEAYPSKGPEFAVLLSQSAAGQRAREGPLWGRAEMVHSKLLECVRLPEISSSSPLRLLGDTHAENGGI